MDGAVLGLLAVRAFVVVTMASFGLQITRDQLIAVLSRPAPVLSVLAVNLAVIPIAGVLLSIALSLPEPVAVGLIVTACAAGSTYSTKLVELCGGDIRVGVGLMFLLAIVSTVLLGPLAAGMIGVFGSATGASVELDPAPILVSLVVFQLLPLVGLMEFQRRAPQTTERLRVPAIRLSTVALVGACIAVVIDSGDELLALGPLPVLAMVALIAIGLVAGYALGGSNPAHRRAMSLITGQRSAALAYIAVHSLGQPAATATVVAFALVMLVVNLGVVVTVRQLDSRRMNDPNAQPEPVAVGRIAEPTVDG